jgi:hypothetical protein
VQYAIFFPNNINFSESAVNVAFEYDKSTLCQQSAGKVFAHFSELF